MRYLEGKERNQFLCSSSLADIFVEWYVGVSIDNFGSIDWDTLWTLLSDNYDVAKAEKNIFEFAELNFKDEDLLQLTEKQQAINSDVKKFLYILHKDINNSHLQELDILNACDSVILASESAKIVMKNSKYKEIDLQLLYFDYLRNKENTINRLAEALEKADDSLLLKDLIFIEGISHIFSLLKVSTVGDLKQFKPEIIGDLLFFANNQLIRNLNLNKEDSIQYLENSIKSAIEKLDSEKRYDYEIFCKGQGIGHRLVKSSQKEIMNKYGLDPLSADRKRREILSYISSLELDLLSTLCVVIYSSFGHQKYYEYEQLEKVLNPEALDIVALLAEYSNDLLINFDRKHYVFFNPTEKSIENLIESISEEINIVIYPDEYNSFNLCKKRIIADEWSKTSNGYYLRKDKTELKLASELITEVFVQGYHIQNDYEELCRLLKEKYGSKFVCPSKSVVVWKVQKDEMFCQIDRGTYLAWNICPELNLLEQADILSYIQEQGELVYYHSIFEHFKDEFKAKGIINQYFVKGIVDHYVDGYGYEKNRDYIKKEGSEMTGQQAILKKILEFDGVFSLQQLRNSFPGVKDYTFTNLIQNCDDVLSLGSSKFVTLINSGVTENGEEIIIRQAQEALKNSGGRAVIAKKILTRIKLFESDWKSELGLISTSTGLYCFLSKSEKGNELFEFHSPYIALKGSNKEEMNFKSSLRKVLSEMDEITYDKFKKTITDLGVNKNYPINFIDVFEEMCDEYLLVDRFKLVKISKLFISKEEIEKVQNKIKILLSRKKYIDSETKSNFVGFPKSIGGYPTNEFLILGLVATFLQNEFDYVLITKGAKLTYKIKEA